MKRHILIFSFVSLFIMPIGAFKTTITSSIYANTDAAIESQFNANPSSIIRRVFFANHATSIPDLPNALDEANKIFSRAMDQANIDLIDIKAEVAIASLADPNAVCEVDIIYTDTIESNSNYYYISLLYQYYPYPVLIPMALSNQSRGGFHGIGMRIRLNENLDYYCGTGTVPEEKFDVTTILLRALAMGCGVQSTFNANTLNVGISDGTTTYVNAFDTQIYNEDSIPLVGVISGQSSLYNFLAGKNIYVKGRDYVGIDTVPIQLYNEWQYFPGSPINSLTLNSIDPYQYYEDLGIGGDDLLTANIQSGVAIRTVTPYTIQLLKRLGWTRTIPVGLPTPFDNVYLSQISCSSTTLQPNTMYMVNVDKEDVYLKDVQCAIYSNDSSYTIGTGFDFLPGITYSNIPANVQWSRDAYTKHIVGHIKATAYKYVNGIQVEQEKKCNILIPYRPNKPIVQKAESFSSSNINLSMRAFANGSNTYTITYTGLTNSDVHSFVVSADAIDTILSIPGTQYYDVSIYGTNAMGNSDTYSFTIGASIQPIINLKVSVSGSTLRYYLNANNATYLPNVQIGTITITNPASTINIHPQASPGDAIDISSLPSGIYLFSVNINGTPYSKSFFKR